MGSALKFIIWLIVTLTSVACLAFEKGSSGYIVTVGKEQTEYELMSFFVLPKQNLKIEVSKDGNLLPFKIDNSDKAVSSLKWTAPDAPKLYTMTVRPIGEKATTLQLFVLHPISMVKNKKLNNYTIGDYPNDVYRGLDAYRKPGGFVEVTLQNQDMLVSPHYRLKQFLCKQNEGYPKYIVLQTKLLRKLEFLTEAINSQGIAMESFTIMSGYRTPYYNTAIKNKKYSRHQWGGAADIYVDENPVDGVMDDLNNDGKINVLDARYLTDMIEGFYDNSSDYKEFVGGLGLYRSNSAHGPFIHVDVRGSKARW